MNWLDWWSELWNILLKILIVATLSPVIQGIFKAVKRRELEKARKIISEAIVAEGDLVVLPRKQVLEKGYVIVTSTNPKKCYECIKWKSLGLRYEAGAVSAIDVCFDVASVVKRGGENLKIVMPGVMVKKGGYAGLIVSCFSTSVDKASLRETLVRGSEYAVGELHYGGGFVEVLLSWVVMNPDASTGRRQRALVMSVCGNAGGKRECVKALELREPGHAEAKHKVPVISKLVVMHKSGYGVEQLAELIKDVPGYFLVKDLTIKLSIRRFALPRLQLGLSQKLRTQRVSRSVK